MLKTVKRETIQHFINLVNGSGIVSAQVLRDYFGNAGSELLACGAIIEAGFSNENESLDDELGNMVPTQIIAGKECYFSKYSGWVPVTPADQLLYRANWQWLIQQLMVQFDVRVEPREAVVNKVWNFGDVWLQKTKFPILLIKKLTRDFAELEAYLRTRHGKKPTLILTLERHISSSMRDLGIHRVLSLHEVMVDGVDDFKIDSVRLAGVMGGFVPKVGFSVGYRTLSAHGQEFKFSSKQAAFMETLDQAGKPMHKTEIMAACGSKQEEPIALFRSKGKNHPVWGKALMNDKNGNYWLEY